MSGRVVLKTIPVGSELAGFIDQSLLSPEATETDIIRLCKSAIKYGFHAVCVNPYYVPLCKAILNGHSTKVATVIGFPLGMTFTEVKIREAMESVKYGAEELDIVINIGAARSGNWSFVGEELDDIIRRTGGTVHKAIIETGYLSQNERIAATKIAYHCGAEFIKTSTGFGKRGASIGDIKLIKKFVGNRAGIKAAGGIKTLKQVRAFIAAGASRIGTSSGISIMKEEMEELS